MRKMIFSSFILVNVFLNHGKLFGNTAYTGIRENITPLEFTCDMGAGINLFNTLDATCNYQSGLATEICWGQPYTTKAMITGIKNRGFKTLRIPVTWYNHMGAGPDFAIDKEWMDRVEEVANYAFQNDMYVIINIHHDDIKSGRPGSWLFPSYEKRDANIAQLEKVWTQIANRFKDYGDYLIFETLNEPRPVETSYEWNGGTAEHREVINDYNLAAVNAIRATGGNNASRFIMVPHIAAQLGAAVNHLIIPNNDQKILVSVHHYSPFPFALGSENVKDWGTETEIQALDRDIMSLYDTYTSKGIGVVMGEWGAGDKGNLAQRVNYYDIYAGIMKKYQVTPVVWMFNYNRTQGEWSTPELEDAILKYFQNGCQEGYPFLSYSNISYGQTFFTGTDLEVDINATDSDGIIQFVDLYVNDVLVGRDYTPPYSWKDDELNDLSAGTYTLRAEAEDNDGNSSTKELVFNVVDPLQVPGIIEAEDFYSESGTQTGPTTDNGGGQNIGFIEKGDWVEYEVEVDEAGMYQIDFRAASNNNNGGIIKVLVDEVSAAEIPVSFTGGWQNWSDFSSGIELPAGRHTLKLLFDGGSGYLLNLNRFEVKESVVTGMGSTQVAEQAMIYPNPTRGILYFKRSKPWVISSILGEKLLSGKTPEADLRSLAPGLYTATQGEFTFRVIKE